MPWLINAAQLDKFRKNQKALIILDASWHHAAEERDAKREFIDKHIVGAQFFDIDIFSDPGPDAPHPHMLIQDTQKISEKLGALGIRDDYKIILYDNSKLHTACRALWMLKVFGHNSQQLYILDGGLAAWENYGGKCETGLPTTVPKQYHVTFKPELIRTLAQMKINLQNPTEQVVDTRHPVRFAGGPEPRSGLRLGHMPDSFSFPFMTLFDKSDCWRPLDKLRHQFNSIGADLTSPVITTCGSGMTAPILNFALDLLGNTQNAMYNGSWSEWGAEKLYPGEQSVNERPVRSSLDE